MKQAIRSILVIMTLFVYCHAWIDMSNPLFVMTNPGEKDYLADSSACPIDCTCSEDESLKCPGNSRPVFDSCGCCKVCPLQLGDSCDPNVHNMCDRGLHCEYYSRECVAKTYRPCFINGEVRPHGYSYKASCDREVFCSDGHVSQRDLCYHAESDRENMKCENGASPGKYKRIGDCCNTLMCEEDVRLKKGKWQRYDTLAGVSEKQTAKLTLFNNKCVAQYTQWSDCSEQCGVGFSERIDSRNSKCNLRKIVRNCMVRPCDVPASYKKKSLEKCKKTWRSKEPEHIQLNGCTSTKKYRPRYCRSCPGFCCKPDVTRTRSIEFGCPNGSVVQEIFMIVKTCVCVPGECAQHIDVGVVMGRDTYHVRTT